MEFLQRFYGAVRLAADTNRAMPMEKYMRHQFPFLGISSPMRKEIVQDFAVGWRQCDQQEWREAFQQIWSQPQREFQYLALELARLRLRDFQAADLNLFEDCLLDRPWWDTVDFIAPTLCARIFSKDAALQAKTIDRWRASENVWLIRSSLIFQLKYREKTDEKLLYSICREHAAHPDFFIRKAIGWALRQYARQNANSVIRFVDQNELSNLSRREALKALRR